MSRRGRWGQPLRSWPRPTTRQGRSAGPDTAAGPRGRGGRPAPAHAKRGATGRATGGPAPPRGPRRGGGGAGRRYGSVPRARHARDVGCGVRPPRRAGARGAPRGALAAAWHQRKSVGGGCPFHLVPGFFLVVPLSVGWFINSGSPLIRSVSPTPWSRSSTWSFHSLTDLTDDPSREHGFLQRHSGRTCISNLQCSYISTTFWYLNCPSGSLLCIQVRNDCSVLISFRCRVAESAATGLYILLTRRPAWTKPLVHIGSAQVNASHHAPSANMERHARRPAGMHGSEGLRCPTIARHSTSLTKLTIS